MRVGRKIMDILRSTMAESTKKKSNPKSFLKSVLKIFRKDDKTEKEHETGKKEEKTKVTSVISPAARFRDNLEKSDRKDKLEKKGKEFSTVEIKDVDEVKKNERLDSQSSVDSGFTDKEAESIDNEVTDIFSNLTIDVKDNKNIIAEKKEKTTADEACKDVAESLNNLKLGEGKGKKEKKVKTVTISRAPIVNKNLTSRSQAHPYANQSSQVTVNRQTFSGGQVIEVDEFREVVDIALRDLESSSIRHENEIDLEDDLEIIEELITNEHNQNTIGSQYQVFNNVMWENLGPERYSESDSILEVFGITHVPDINVPDNMMGSSGGMKHHLPGCLPSQSSNAITSPDDKIDLSQSLYETPPSSVTMPSPLSDFESPPRASSSDYIFPPGRSSPFLAPEMETYLPIPQLEEIENEEKKMNLKQFKNMQKEISKSFCNKECCQKKRKSCNEIFNERFEKFEAEERRNICLNICRLDLKAAMGVLVKILLSIAKGSDKEALEYVIFRQVCERVLGEHPDWFLGEFGATLVELAAYRCSGHPVLTRYLVECVRAARGPGAVEDKGCLLPLRVDSKRDNLVIACALGGDAFADALYWLVAREPHQPPLFDLGHVNAEGYSALHVACKSHSAAAPRLHVAHVLLEHGRVDLGQGDLKGGDTALHLAVNSPTCDLQLVLLLFHQTDQKHWKQLATCLNLGSVTPIEYARCAVKSKPYFPAKVLEFMKKLR